MGSMGVNIKKKSSVHSQSHYSSLYSTPLYLLYSNSNKITSIYTNINLKLKKKYQNFIRNICFAF